MKKLLFLTAALIAVAAPAHADPVTAVATWIATSLNVGVATAFAIANTAIGIGVSAIASAFQRPPEFKGASVQFDVQMADDLPLSFTVGEYATAGKRKYIKSWGKNTRFITEVIEFSALPQSLSRMWIDDEPWSVVAGRRGSVPTGAGPDPIESVIAYNEGSLPAGHVDLGAELNNYRDDGDSTNPRMWVKWVDGTQTAADPLTIFAATGDTDYPWTAAMIGEGKAYAVVTVRYDSDSMTSYPAYLFEPEPLPVYDIRQDSSNGGSGSHRWNNPATWEPSRNPAVIAYNIIRGIRFEGEWIFGGKDLDAWRLPSAEWIAAANACDETVNLSGGGTERRYRCGMEISVDVKPVDVLEELGRAANMRFAEVGGQIKPVVDIPATSVFSFTDEDIITTEGQSLKPFYPVTETYNALSATYPEPGEKWASKDAKEYIDADATADDGGRYLPTSISYGAAPFAKQVQRLQRSQMRDFRRMRRHQFYLPPEAYALEPGIDTVSWTSGRNGYDSKRFMVETVVKTPGMNVLVSLREINPSDYDWSSDFEAPVTITVPRNPVRITQPINGLTVTPAAVEDRDGIGRRPAILVACDGDEVGVTDIQIQARVSGRPVTIDTTRRFADPHAWYLRDVLASTDYEVRARLLSRLTPKSSWSSWLSVRTPDIGLTWLDFEEEVTQAVADAQAQAAAAAEAAADADEKADDIRADLTSAQTSLSDEIDAVEQLAIDNLNIARNYTDTSVQSETTARQTATDALAAQINSLTAVLNSENYLENPRFSDDLTGWAGHTGSATVVAQDEASPDPITANAPAANFVELDGHASFNRELLQVFSVDLDTGEVFQWRLNATSAGTGRDLDVMIQFLDSGGASLGHPSTTISLTQNEWRVFSGQEVPPDGTVSVRFRTRITPTAATDPIAITDLSFTKVDQSAIARITDLEVVVADNHQAFTAHRDSANSRLDAAEADITTESATRASETGALASQMTTVSAEASRVRTFRNSTAPANPRNGDIWYDTSNHNRPYRWWDGSWLPVEDSRIDSLTATVTTQATAISDLEGNASAGYLIRAQAGGSVSLLDLVAADGSNGSVSVAKLDADHILLKGSVAADMLTVMDLSGNMVPDAEMVSPSSWGIDGDPDWIMLSPDEFNWVKGESAGEIQCSVTGSYDVKNSLTFSILEGETYTFSGIIRAIGNNAASAAITVGWLDNQENMLSQDTVVGLGDNGFNEGERSLTAPEDARRARIRLLVYSNNSATVGFSSVSCIRKRSGATLITPGGVTSDLITGNTMRALLGQFVSLEAANLTVGTGEIDTLNIKGDAIYAPYNFSRSDLTISRDRSDPHTIISRTITGFEGGGFTAFFSAVVDTINQGPDNFCVLYMEVNGQEVARSRFGVRSSGDGDVKYAIPAHLIATTKGSSSVHVAVYGFSREFSNAAVSSGPLDITNITLSISGSKR
ncbi:phage tail protein [Paracoccus sp. Z330]|uniref:Phage tail protein n=1 Tax=Paracoccus onchidii TaxID=3017813 RepID=A0ABT4ZEZ2_9RHOB|nr:phage tail protein [Paracoccus onchidii]MDB6177943.1 phage tail protein [Paracoccus onchidii]